MCEFQTIFRKCATHAQGSLGCHGEVSVNQATIVKIERVENIRLWRRYSAWRAYCSKLPKPDEVMCCPDRQHAELEDCEVYLFHGTSLENAKLITQDGFDIRKARNGLYGRGVYFAEETCKAHQYTKRIHDETGNIFCMLYCRVVLGNTYNFSRTETGPSLSGMVRPQPGDAAFSALADRSGEWYNSVRVGSQSDTARTPQVHREYVVYDAAQAYPEYAVFYQA